MRKQLIIFFSLLLCDQLLKYVFGGYSFIVIQGLLGFGVSTGDKIMGLFNYSRLFLWFLVLLYTVLIFLIYRYWGFINQSGTALVFLLAGMTSNLGDWVFFGYVRDYINILGTFYFNLADFVIIGGIIVLSIRIFNLKFLIFK